MMNKDDLDAAMPLGVEVQVQTSYFERTSAGVRLYPDTWQPRFYAHHAAVRALLKSGRYEGETFWRGATLTKLREA